MAQPFSYAACVAATWAVAEAALHAGRTAAAVAALDALLERPVPPAHTAADVATRVRLGDVLLHFTANGGGDLPRRVLEAAAATLAAHPGAATPGAKAQLHRLLGVAQRRAQRYDQALQSLAAAAQYVARASDAAAAPGDVLQPGGTLALAAPAPLEVELEAARVHYARAAVGGFRDAADVDALRAATADYAVPHCAGAVPLAALHATALLVARRYEDAALVLGAGGWGGESFALLHRLLLTATGGPASDVPSQSPEPAATGAVAAPWLQPECLDALRGYLDVAGLATAGHHAECTVRFNALMSSVEAAIRTATAATVPTPGRNGATRFLVAVKIAAYAELVLVDLTRLDLAAAASKLDPLCAYVTMFHRHTAHFRATLHTLIAAYATLCRRDHDAARHLNVAAAAADPTGPDDADLGDPADAMLSAAVVLPFADAAAAAVPLLRAALDYSGRSRDTATAAAFDTRVAAYAAGRDAHQGREGGPWGLGRRTTLQWDILAGAAALDRADHEGAASLLRTAGDTARTLFGSAHPLVATALLLLAQARAMGGSHDQATTAAAMASQVAARAGDEGGSGHCAGWVASHALRVSDSDQAQRVALHRSIEGKAAHYAAQCRTADVGFIGCSEAADRVLRFLPDAPEYKAWLRRVRTSAAAHGRTR